MKPAFVESGAPMVGDAAERSRIYYRWVCDVCRESGQWHTELPETESFARLHNRTKHAEEARA